MHYDYECLQEKMIEVRKYRGLSQHEIAEKFKFEAGSYSKWERGKAIPNARQIAKLAEIEEIDINFFFKPNMSISDADLKQKDRRDILEKIASRLENIETKITPHEKFDSVLHTVKTRKNLYEFVQMIIKIDNDALSEIRGMVRGFLVGKGQYNKFEQERENKQNAG